MSRRVLVLVIALVAPLGLLGGLSRLQPAAAAVGSASSQCMSLDANTASCTLSLGGSLVPGETVTVAISAGTLDQVSYASGCQPSGALTQPAIAAGGGSFSFTAPDGGCAGPVAFTETVGGLNAPGTLVQSVTDSGAPGTVINTSVSLVSFSGSKSCTAGAGAGTFTCQLSVDASANMANTTIGVALSDGVFTGATFVSGCLNPPSLTVSPTSFSFSTPAGGCGGFGPLVFSETVAGVSGSSLTQTVSASGAFAGTGSITAQLPAQTGGAVTLTGTKVCSRANSSGESDDNGDDLAFADDAQVAGVSCTLSLQPSAPLAAGAMVTVQIGGNAAFASVNYGSGCASAPAVSTGGASFSFPVPDGGCAGPLVFSESLSLTGSGGGALAQTATVSGASSGSVTIPATRSDGSAFTLPSAQNSGGNGQGNGGGNGQGNGNGDNHTVPACQNSRGRAQQHNPHCQGGDD